MSITIVGAGILSPNQITLEADEALRKSSLILYLLDLNPRMRRYLRSLGAPLVDLDPIYREGAFDEDVYLEIARRVTDAHDKYDRVTLVVPGHPMIYVAPTSLILERAEMLGIKATVLPGISSLDTMLLQVQLEIGARGLQVFECTRLIYYAYEPDPRMPLFLLQPGAVGTAFLTHKTRSKPHRFEILVEALRGVYPAEHPIYLLVSQCSFSKLALKKRIRLRDLPRNARFIDYDTSLFVPPLRKFEVKRKEFYESLFDPYTANTLVRKRVVKTGRAG